MHTLPANWRELDYREADGGALRVRLTWNKRSGSVAIEVEDDREGNSYVRAIPPCAAHEAFQHPFVWVGRKAVMA